MLEDFLAFRLDHWLQLMEKAGGRKKKGRWRRQSRVRTVKQEGGERSHSNQASDSQTLRSRPNLGSGERENPKDLHDLSLPEWMNYHRVHPHYCWRLGMGEFGKQGLLGKESYLIEKETDKRRGLKCTHPLPSNLIWISSKETIRASLVVQMVKNLGLGWWDLGLPVEVLLVIESSTSKPKPWVLIQLLGQGTVLWAGLNKSYQPCFSPFIFELIWNQTHENDQDLFQQCSPWELFIIKGNNPREFQMSGLST